MTRAVLFEPVCARRVRAQARGKQVCLSLAIGHVVIGAAQQDSRRHLPAASNNEAADEVTHRTGTWLPFDLLIVTSHHQIFHYFLAFHEIVSHAYDQHA